MKTYKITYLGRTYTIITSSLQKACRKAFAFWISQDQKVYKVRLVTQPKEEAKKGLILRQPKTLPDGGWLGVTVESEITTKTIENIK